MVTFILSKMKMESSMPLSLFWYKKSGVNHISNNILEVKYNAWKQWKMLESFSSMTFSKTQITSILSCNTVMEEIWSTTKAIWRTKYFPWSTQQKFWQMSF